MFAAQATVTLPPSLSWFEPQLNRIIDKKKPKYFIIKPVFYSFFKIKTTLKVLKFLHFLHETQKFYFVVKMKK
jgi:hypothetical protein